MKIEKNNLPKSRAELLVELSPAEFKPYIDKGAVKISQEVKIEGFRPGKAPYEILKQKIGEMTILEEAARLAINATLGPALREQITESTVGQPEVDIIKLAPGNPLVYKAVLALLPPVTLEAYKDLKIKKKAVKLDDQEVDKTLAELAEMHVREQAVERPAKTGDKVLADIQMFLDNVPIEGGQNKSAALIIGKDYIVPGFDKQLAGLEKGAVKEFKLPYPKDFHMKNLAGRPVEFKVKINDVFERAIPELNDEFARKFGLKDQASLKNSIITSLTRQKEEEQSQIAERLMLEKIMEKSKFGDIPEMLINSESHSMMHELEDSLAGQGAKLDDYLQSINKTRDQITLDMLPDAVKRVKISLLIREIANQENIKIDDGEIDRHIKQMKEAYKGKKEIIERLDASDYRSYAANMLSSRKTIDKLKEWNIL